MEFAAGATLILQSLFVWSFLHAGNGFIYFKGWYPFKLKKSISAETVKKELAIDTTNEPP